MPDWHSLRAMASEAAYSAASEVISYKSKDADSAVLVNALFNAKTEYYHESGALEYKPTIKVRRAEMPVPQEWDAVTVQSLKYVVDFYEISQSDLEYTIYLKEDV